MSREISDLEMKQRFLKDFLMSSRATKLSKNGAASEQDSENFKRISEWFEKNYFKR